MGDTMLKRVDFTCLQELLKGEMDQNMEQLQNSIDQKMEQLQNSRDQKMEYLLNSMVDMILHILDERIHKGDNVTQGNHENKDNFFFQPQSHMENILTNAKNIKIESYNHDYSSLQGLHNLGYNLAQRNYFIPKIDMSKFDGKDLITWIFYMDII